MHRLGNHELTWYRLPRDYGQTVDVNYAVDWEHDLLYRRRIHRSDMSQVIERAHVIPRHGEFVPVELHSKQELA